MKTFKKLALLFFASGILFTTACKKDKSEDETNDNTQTTDTTTTNKPIVYNVEQNKSNIEAEGVKMINNLRELKNSEAIKVSNHLISLIQINDPMATSRSKSTNAAIKILHALKQFSQKGDVNLLYSSMRSTTEDPSTPQEAFDQIKGSYTWNASTQTWVKEASSSFVLLFPSADGVATNDASFTLTYAAYNGTQPFTNYEGDLPQAINASLKVNGTAKITFNFSATYDSHGVPSLASITLDVLKFKLSETLNHTDSGIEFTNSFKNDGVTIFEVGASATGTFTYSNMENLANDQNQIANIEDVTKIATKLAYHTQLMRYLLTGEVDLEGLSADIKAAGGSNALTEEQQVTVINDNYSLKVLDTQNKNAVVATTEFYVTTNTYQTYEYSETQQQWVEVTKTEKNLDMRMVFPDGSKNDMATYTKSGFEDLQNEVEKFATELQNEFDNNTARK